MIPQTTKWVIVSYADNAFAATAAQVKSQLEKRYDLRGFNVLDRKILTQPSGDDFSSYLPPTKEEVLGKRKYWILMTLNYSTGSRFMWIILKVQILIR